MRAVDSARMMRGRTGLAALFLAAAGTLTWLAWARLDSVHHRTFDLALYSRVAWGLARGEFWSPVLDTHAFGAHFSPVLWMLGLVTRLTGGTARVLLLVQALCITFAMWPMARLGSRHLGTSGAWLGALAWLLYPNLWHVGGYEFHPGTLAVLPLCYAAEAIDRGALRDVAIALACACLCRDDVGVTCALFAVVHGARHGHTRNTWLLAAGCLAYAGVAMGITLAHAPSDGSLDQHFGAWGGSPLGVVTALFTEPGRVFSHFGTPARLLYVPALLAPLLAMPLRAPWWLLAAAPTWLLNLASTFPTTEQFYSHYQTLALPALISAGIIGLGRSSPWLRAPWLAALALGHALVGGGPLSTDFPREDFRVDQRTRAARRVLDAIPPGASVQAPDALLPHLAARVSVHRAPPPDRSTEWVVLDVAHRDRYRGTEDLLRTTEEPRVRNWLARTDYGVVLGAHPFLLLQRGHDPREVLEGFHSPANARVQGTPLTACLELLDAVVGKQLRVRFRARTACPPDLAVRFGPSETPARVELLFSGEASPAHLRDGDTVSSSYTLEGAERRAIEREGLWVGVLRSSGARPDPSDPLAVPALRPSER